MPKRTKQPKAICITTGCLNQVSVGSRSGRCRACYQATRKIAGSHVRTQALRTTLETYRTEDSPTQRAPTAAEAFKAAVRVTDHTKEVPLLRGDAVWCSDVHVPAHDPWLCDNVRKVGIYREIDTLIVLGDLLDNENISSYSQSAAKTMPLAEQILRALQVLAGWATHYRKIYVVQGNHDDRIMRVIEAASKGRTYWQKILDSLDEDFDGIENMPYRQRYVHTLTEFMDRNAPALSDTVTWLPLPLVYAEGPSGGKPILMVHPAVYSRNAPHEALNIWQREVSTVISSHTHGAGLRVAPDGVELLVNAGCMTHAKHHRYLHERIKGGPAWARGFGAIRQGRIELWMDNIYAERWDELEGIE